MQTKDSSKFVTLAQKNGKAKFAVVGEGSIWTFFEGPDLAKATADSGQTLIKASCRKKKGALAVVLVGGPAEVTVFKNKVFATQLKTDPKSLTFKTLSAQDAAELDKLLAELEGPLATQVGQVKNPALELLAKEAEELAEEGELAGARAKFAELKSKLAAALQPSVTPTQKQTAPDNHGLEFRKALQRLMPLYQEELKNESADRGVLEPIMKLITAAATAKNFEEGLIQLARLDDVLKEAAQYKDLYLGLMSTLPKDLERLKQRDAATASKIKAIVDAAAGHEEKGEYKKAFTFLNQAATALAKALSTARVKDASDVIPEGKVAEMREALQKVRIRWDGGIQQAVAEMKKVQDGLRKVHPQLASALSTVLDGYHKDLTGFLVAAEKAQSGPEIDQQRAEVLKQTTTLKAKITTDALLAHLDTLPFGARLQKTIDVALTEIQALAKA